MGVNPSTKPRTPPFLESPAHSPSSPACSPTCSPEKIEMSFNLSTYQPHLRAAGCGDVYQTYFLDAKWVASPRFHALHRGPFHRPSRALSQAIEGPVTGPSRERPHPTPPHTHTHTCTHTHTPQGQGAVERRRDYA